jgi:hypothetical protein
MRRCNGETWLLGTTFAYFFIGCFDLFVYRFTDPDYILAAWLVILGLPLWINPLAQYLGMRTFREK